MRTWPHEKIMDAAETHPHPHLRVVFHFTLGEDSIYPERRCEVRK